MNNSEKQLLNVSEAPVKVRLNNGFIVTDFIVNTGIDFLYSKKDGAFYLLNLSTMGDMEGKEVTDLVKNGYSVAIIEGLNMEVYNMNEKTVLGAMLGI